MQCALATVWKRKHNGKYHDYNLASSSGYIVSVHDRKSLYVWLGWWFETSN